MQGLRILGGLSLVLVSSSAMALSATAMTDLISAGLTNTVNATSDATSSDDDDKVVQAARDDAAQYVASQGQQKGVYLEAALQRIRQRHPELQASDLQLAQAILSQ